MAPGGKNQRSTDNAKFSDRAVFRIADIPNSIDLRNRESKREINLCKYGIGHPPVRIEKTGAARPPAPHLVDSILPHSIGSPSLITGSLAQSSGERLGCRIAITRAMR